MPEPITLATPESISLHKAILATQRVGLQVRVSYECTCGLVFAEKTADQCTHVEYGAVMESGKNAARAHGLSIP